MKKFEYITEGPILKSLFKLSLPIMLSQLMQTLYNLADTLWVGKLGADAVAAISISFPLVFLMIAIAAGMTIAGTSIIAQYKGAGNDKEVERVLGQLFSFIISISVILGIIGSLLSRKIMLLIGADSIIIDQAVGYIRIIFLGMPFMFGFFIFSSVLRGIGNTVTPAVMMVVSVVLNIILDPLIIFGIGPFPSLGIQGAAVATIFSRAVVTIYALVLLLKGSKGLTLKLKNLVPDFEIIRLIVKIGVPSSIEQSMLSLGQLFMTTLVTSFGTMTLAAYGIVNRIISLPIILALGLSAAATTMVGQNIGAGKKERAEKAALLGIITIFLGLTGLGIVMFVESEVIIAIFNNFSKVVEIGSDYLKTISLTVGFIGVMNVSSGVFKGAGRTIPPMVVTTLSQWIFRVALSYLLIDFFAYEQLGIWSAIALSNIAGAIISIIWLKSVNWSEKVIEDKKSKVDLILQEG